MAVQCRGSGGPTAPYCDVGPGLPAGEYLFDFRAANVSINGMTLAEWFVEQHFFNASDGANNDIVSGFCKRNAYSARMQHSHSEVQKLEAAQKLLSSLDVACSTPAAAFSAHNDI